MYGYMMSKWLYLGYNVNANKVNQMYKGALSFKVVLHYKRLGSTPSFGGCPP